MSSTATLDRRRFDVATTTLAFESDGAPAETTALVARQDGDTYEGFWTDDPRVTRDVASTLATV